METSFYDDESNGHRGAMNKLKSKMTLDFGGGSAAKKQKVMGPLGVLASPDLNLLKLASPELERMIIQQNGLVTTTPTPTQFLCPKYVTEEQEAYARGFVDALEELHKQEGDVPLPGTAEYEALGLAAASSAAVLAPTATPPQYTTMQNVQSVSTTNNVTVSSHNPSIPSTSGSAPQYSTLSTTASLPGVYAPNSHVTSTSSMSSMPSSMSHHHSQPQVPSQLGQVSMLPATVVSEASSTFPNAIVSNGRLMQLKEEPQLVPCMGDTPPISPINMDQQEAIKVERKRERNRVAARKCRTRKLERISRLEERVDDLKGQNADLVQTAKDLRDQVCKLKEQIMTHVKSGCQVMLSQNLL